MSITSSRPKAQIVAPINRTTSTSPAPTSKGSTTFRPRATGSGSDSPAHVTSSFIQRQSAQPTPAVASKSTNTTASGTSSPNTDADSVAAAEIVEELTSFYSPGTQANHPDKIDITPPSGPLTRSLFYKVYKGLTKQGINPRLQYSLEDNTITAFPMQSARHEWCLDIITDMHKAFVKQLREDYALPIAMKECGTPHVDWEPGVVNNQLPVARKGGGANDRCFRFEECKDMDHVKEYEERGDKTKPPNVAVEVSDSETSNQSMKKASAMISNLVYYPKFHQYRERMKIIFILDIRAGEKTKKKTIELHVMYRGTKDQNVFTNPPGFPITIWPTPLGWQNTNITVPVLRLVDSYFIKRRLKDRDAANRAIAGNVTFPIKPFVKRWAGFFNDSPTTILSNKRERSEPSGSGSDSESEDEEHRQKRLRGFQTSGDFQFDSGVGATGTGSASG